MSLDIAFQLAVVFLAACGRGCLHCHWTNKSGLNCRDFRQQHLTAKGFPTKSRLS